MATTIDWFGGDGANEIVPAESGEFDTLGFFGASFGFSIRVGEFNNTCRVTNDNGTTENGQIPNLRFANATGAFVGPDLIARELLQIDNDEATLRIRLSTDSSVATQNSAFRAFDRININNGPSGVLVNSIEIIKLAAAPIGSGDNAWIAIAGTGDLDLDDQVAPSSVHTWYVGLTASPQSIGEKTDLGFYFETEFL